VIDWQGQQDALAYQALDTYHFSSPELNTFPATAPVVDYELSYPDPTGLDGDNTILDNLMAYSSKNATPESASISSRSKSSPDEESSKPALSSSSSSARVEKRKANTLAARRYRQKRLDKVTELELALKATELERDALKVQVAKLQGETQVLKDLARGGFGAGGG